MNKAFSYLRNTLAIIGAIAIIIYCLDSSPLFPFTRTEINRIPSPNSEYEIVVLRKQAASFSTPTIELYVVPYSTEFSEDSEDFESYKFQAVALRKAQWISDDKIVIYRLAKDRVYHFESEYYDPQGHEEPTGYPKINLELVTKTY